MRDISAPHSAYDPFKRAFDVLVAAAALLVTGWLIAAGWLIARVSSGGSGFFRQERVGRHGKLFRIVKLRTMRADASGTTVTTAVDSRLTTAGRWLRRLKIDELPQFFNVLVGEMSVVGPRPDVADVLAMLSAEDRVILSLRPGITGPATVAFRNEESLLGAQPDPERYSREVIWPEKVRLNREYVERQSFLEDCKWIVLTLLPRSGSTSRLPK